MKIETNAGLNKLSKIISNVFNPVVSLLLFFIYHYTYFGKLDEAAKVFLPVLLIIVLPCAAWIFYGVKTGNYANADVSDRNKRESLYYFLDACFLVYFLVDYLMAHRINLHLLTIGALMLLLQISNYWIKSSMHTAFASMAACFFYMDSPFLGCIFGIITIIVAISRLILKKHTLAEVLMGAALATGTAFLILK